MRENPAAWMRIHDQINGIAPSYPPLLTQAGNAVKAAAGFVASGFAVADQAEQERRLAICQECEFFDHARSRCTKCGCIAVWKAWVASQKCPIGKW